MKQLSFLGGLLALTPFAAAQVNLAFGGQGGSNGSLLLAKDSNNTAPTICVSSNDHRAVHRAAADLAADFGRVVGTNGTVITSNCQSDGPVIIVGSLGSSTVIDQLAASSKVDAASIRGKWEVYTSAVVTDPVPGVASALVIAGSDRRGAIFGMYSVSEGMGVSPWYWWADVPSKKKDSVWAVVSSVPQVQAPPSVKWRGIFINNEAPSLSTWANGRFKRSAYGSDLTDEFYARVFELILRLRGNYIWPAMWGKMFYLDTADAGRVSDDYGVVVGTSHHEPMARSEREQTTFMQGRWDWETNRQNVSRFFREGVQRASDKETLYTLGMRGAGDAENPGLTPELLEEIVGAQQEIIREELKVTDLHDVPQTWVLYTEVGKYYQGGMKVPDSVTLLWADDNYGNLLRTPLSNETDHGAGHGVYFHFDFNGGIRCYKWINTIQNIKTWEQMHLAYEKGAREIWITNVGDIKPLEIPISHFMDMAYDFTKHTTPESVAAWTKQWAAAQFGEGISDATTEILTTYGQLTVRRKYEMLSNLPFTWSVSNYDEATIVLQEWVDLLAKTQAVHDGLTPDLQLPFFEMVLHPVLAGKTVIDLYIKAALNNFHASQGRASTNALADEVKALFAEDQRITNRYHGLLGGKWNGMVIQPHIGYYTWSDPPNNIMPNVTYLSVQPSGAAWSVALEGGRVFAPGNSAASSVMYSIDPYAPEAVPRWLEVFARRNGSFSYAIESSADYVKVDGAAGTVTAPGPASEVRSVVSVDWAAAPEGRTEVELTVRRTGSSEVVSLILPVVKRAPAASFRGHVESGGVVSIEPEHFSASTTVDGVAYTVLPGYGRTLSGVKLWPVTAPSLDASTAPKLSYKFHAFSGSTNASLTVHLGTSINHDPARPLKYAFALDDGAVRTVQPVPDYPMGTLPPGWQPSTIAGGWPSMTTVGTVGAGEHRLDLWLLEPGVVVQKIVLNLGGLRASAQGPPASVVV